MKIKAALVGGGLVLLSLIYLWYEAQLAQQQALLSRVQSDLTVEQMAVHELAGVLDRTWQEQQRYRQQLQQMTEARNRAEARAQVIEARYVESRKSLQYQQSADPELAAWSAAVIPAAADQWLRQLFNKTPAQGGD